MPHYNLYPLLDLITREDPLEISRHLDDALSYMVQFSEHEGHLLGLGYRYILLRAVRDAFYKVALEQIKAELQGDNEPD